MLNSDSASAPFSQGFAAFYEANAESLLVYFARRTYDAEVAFDLTAETFAEALVSRSRFKGQGEGSAERWLYGIARNVLRQFLRKGQVEKRALARLGMDVPAISEPETERIEALAELAGLRAELKSALTHLNRDQREALDLRVIRELSYPEIAERLSISEATVRARVSRGLRKLGDHLDGLRAEKGQA